MTATETACYSTPEEINLRVENLSFARIPQQSRLFLDYLQHPLTLKHFYPNAVNTHIELAAYVPEVLAAYQTNRGTLCDALEALNTVFGAGVETLQNIARLRESNCVAVVSGQQVGLFTGPLYTIYKALSAVKLAKCLSQRGVEAVPVFWLATEDHDWDEVKFAEVLACDGSLAHVKVESDVHANGAPVGSTVLDEKINETIARLIDNLPSTEFTSELEHLLRDSYTPGRTYGEAFARFLTALIGQHGLILLDPLDVNLKKLAAPLYAESARRAPEIANALAARTRELEAANYHAQVLVSEDSFPLFLHKNNARHALARTRNGNYKVKGSDEEFTVEELATRALNEPENFSPNVTLRAVVQDYLLPTLCYFGGGAEIAYFAQTSEVYRLLKRPVTPIFHRASLTIIERRAARTLARYNLRLEDFFAGEEALTIRVVETHLGADTARAFKRAEETVAHALAELRDHLKTFDVTLADATQTGARKVDYQLEKLRGKFMRAQLARNRAAHRQLERAFAALYPEKTLQERHLNIATLYARHGRYILDWIYDAINLNSNEHRLVFL
ncbi:MAG: bacillithiol biosynthesis cysteine-adding enzyme BshC [Pyrinomonadaceae bacterium]